MGITGTQNSAPGSRLLLSGNLGISASLALLRQRQPATASGLWLVPFRLCCCFLRPPDPALRFGCGRGGLHSHRADPLGFESLPF